MQLIPEDSNRVVQLGLLLNVLVTIDDTLLELTIQPSKNSLDLADPDAKVIGVIPTMLTMGNACVCLDQLAPLPRPPCDEDSQPT